ncbi:MAG TPA: ribose-5-phosphate isomerase RpiA [Thermomicrobiales bacterium]|nr:ribose-5-phosphate isomerase RpiA [Thermomicrobiales bacterium]
MVDDRLTRLGGAAAGRIEDGMLVGLGTGSTAEAMVQALGARVGGGLSITGVATSFRTAELARSFGIPLKELAEIDRLDLCIDGADEIDPALNLVKGRGGALLFEKLVARRADRYLIIATDEKLVDRLGVRMPLPVEIVPTGWTHTAEAIAALGLAPGLRRIDGGTAYLTDGGHYIVDCAWPDDHQFDPATLAAALKALTGVVDHGLFIGMADTALTVDAAGAITEHRRP